MANEFRTFTVNLKSMDQNIPDPIVAGGADANGRKFKLIFDQEAAAQMTPETKVYLSWCHQQRRIKGYNVFTCKDDDMYVWEIYWPKTMLHEGDVMCCVEIVDDISIVSSQNFIVHVLSDPNDGSSFVVSDDFTVFQEAVIDMNSAVQRANEQMDSMRSEFDEWRPKIEEAVNTANEAKESVDKLRNDLEHMEFSAEVNMTEF